MRVFGQVKELSEGRGEPTTTTAKPAQLPEAVKEAVKKAEAVPTKPPPAYEFMADPATINSFDLCVCKFLVYQVPTRLAAL